jgi:hypothetical protein
VSLRKSGLSDPVEHAARDCFSQSAEILAEADIKGERARTLREWAKYEFDTRTRSGALELWHEARAIFEGLGAHMEVKRMEELPSSTEPAIMALHS